MSWPQVVFGWPAALAALALYGLGLAQRRWLAALVGFVVALPFLWYLFGSPRLEYGVPLIALSNVLSVIALAKGHRLLALVALVPFLATVAWLAYTVLAQNAAA